MASAKMAIRVALRDEDAKRGLRRLTREFKRSATNINASLEIASKAGAVLLGSVKALLGPLAESVKLAQVQEEAERKLAAALEARGEFTEANFAALQKLNGEIQNAIGIGDEELLQLQARMSAMGVRVDQLGEATRAAVTLNKVLGADLSAAVNASAKALRGDVGALREYGITAKDTADAQRQLNALWKTTLSDSQTLGTRIKVLDAAWGDFKEVLGATVSESTALKSGTDAITDAVQALTDVLANPATKLAVDGFFRSLALGFSSLIDAGLGAEKILNKVINTIDTARGKVNVSPLDPATGLTPRESTNAALENLSNQLRKLGLEGPAVSGRGGRSGRSGTGPLVGGTVRPRAKRRLLSSNADALNAFDAEEFQAQANDEYTAALEARYQAQVAHEQRAEQLAQESARKQAGIWGDLAEFSGSALSGVFSGLVSDIASGENAGRAFSGFLGSLLETIGTFLVQAGTAAIVAGTLGQIVPFLAPATGGAAGVGAGVAAVAAGGAILVAASALGGSGSGAPASTRAQARGSGGSGRLPRLPRLGEQEPGLQRFGDLTDRHSVTNVYFTGPVGGDRRRIARDLGDLLSERNALRAGG